MSAEFIKMISEIQFERFNVHYGELIKNKIPCGVFFGFVMIPIEAAKNVQMHQKNGINLSCVVVLADVQADALRNLVNIPVITLEDFSRFGEENFPVKPQEILTNDTVFFTYFIDHGIEILTYSDDRNFLFTMKHLPKLFSVYEMLGDDESRKTFCAAIKGRITGKISHYRFAPEAQYFLDGFYPNAGDIAIDGGAYNGSTAISFAKCGAKVYAFEMDAFNYQNCISRINSSGGGIILENLGLSDKKGTAPYFSMGIRGTGSRKASNGNLTAKFIDLDTYAKEKNIPRIDYIKLDIEGAELEMLHGAAKTITRCKPKMAISAYHKPEDLWTLATYVKSLRPDYQLEFRHYKIDCSDYFLDEEERAILKYFGLDYFLSTGMEYVLYCR